MKRDRFACFLNDSIGRINIGARVVICGAISQYNAVSEAYAPKQYYSLLVNRAKMEGFIIFDYAKRQGAISIGFEKSPSKYRAFES